MQWMTTVNSHGVAISSCAFITFKGNIVLTSETGFHLLKITLLGYLKKSKFQIPDMNVDCKVHFFYL